MGWSSFSEDDIPSGEAGTLDEEGVASFCELIISVRESLGLPMPSSLASTLQTGVKCTLGTSRPGPTPLVLPRSPLSPDVRREQLGCSLGISNSASAKFALPRRSGSGGALAGLFSAAPQRGLDCLGALARANLDIMQPCEMLHLRMVMFHRQAGVRNLPNTYGDRERRQLMSSPVGFHLFGSQTLAAVEQRELESSQWSLVSQIASGLASTAQGVRAKAGYAIGSRPTPCTGCASFGSAPPAPKVSGSFCSQGFFHGKSGRTSRPVVCEYLRRTRDCRLACSRLLVTVSDPRRAFHPNTLSKWICQVIWRVYASISEE
ncbi:hypothetical protein E2C01_050875 [Portunus trituberculatus]|uniref:Uncharacterized protein n=1 Tax=Portunus trituberculatus TaxID=210409 RepID=A0A5B7GH94_PORTR|nr:hypothetical protein [Portunus trituberculatus]